MLKRSKRVEGVVHLGVRGYYGNTYLNVSNLWMHLRHSCNNLVFIQKLSSSPLNDFTCKKRT